MVEYCQIETTQGQVAQVSPEDWDMLSEYKWGVQRIRNTGRFYAISRMGRSKVNGDQPPCLAMHRVIMGNPEDRVVDHINGDGLDNRRANLRLATVSQNASNCRTPITNTSGYKGVSWSKKSRRWQSLIRFDGNRRFLGLYNTPLEAHEAYCAAARELHGEFARPK